MPEGVDQVLNFWFEETPPKKLFQKSPAFDGLILKRFGNLHRKAAACELWSWRKTPEGRLAEIIILDQFSRNLFRDQVEAFSCDPLALALAQTALAADADRGFDDGIKKMFFYMPFMHSESLIMHEQAVILFSKPGLESNLDYELRHKRIIENFGRYPHRNALLKRVSSKEELDFLQQPDSSF